MALALALVCLLAFAAVLFALRERKGRRRSLLEANRTRDDALALADSRVDELAAAHAQSAAFFERATTWERKFWEMHAVVERVIAQRDVWQDMFREQVKQHLEGQAILEAKIIMFRQHVVRAVATTNRLIKEHELDRPIIVAPRDMDPLTGPPVGQARAYFDAMRTLLVEHAPDAFDAVAERDAIDVDVSEPPPLSGEQATTP